MRVGEGNGSHRPSLPLRRRRRQNIILASENIFQREGCWGPERASHCLLSRRPLETLVLCLSCRT